MAVRFPEMRRNAIDALKALCDQEWADRNARNPALRPSDYSQDLNNAINVLADNKDPPGPIGALLIQAEVDALAVFWSERDQIAASVGSRTLRTRPISATVELNWGR